MRAGECLCHWREGQEPIGHPETCRFFSDGLSYAIDLYGSPAIRVKEVSVVFRPDIPPETVIESRAEGVFTIHVGGETHFWFYAQLAHEIAHLLNADLHDCYVEGLNFLFAEKLLTKKSKGWRRCKQHLKANRRKKNREAFYAAAYFMMKDVLRIAGEKRMSTFLQHTMKTNKGEDWMHISIDRWLESLPDEKRCSVKAKIEEHASEVNTALRFLQPDYRRKYVFVLPSTDS